MTTAHCCSQHSSRAHTYTPGLAGQTLQVNCAISLEGVACEIFEVFAHKSRFACMSCKGVAEVEAVKQLNFLQSEEKFST